MARKALVTGATGLLGREVVKAFEKEGWSVIGTGFTRATPPSIRKLDLNDSQAIEALLHQERYGML
jgi:S-adenosylmethionine synthetase